MGGVADDGVLFFFFMEMELDEFERALVYKGFGLDDIDDRFWNADESKSARRVYVKRCEKHSVYVICDWINVKVVFAKGRTKCGQCYYVDGELKNSKSVDEFLSDFYGYIKETFGIEINEHQ